MMLIRQTLRRARPRTTLSSFTTAAAARPRAQPSSPSSHTINTFPFTNGRLFFSSSPPRPSKPSKGQRRPINTPVTWASLAICVVVGTGLVTYYQSEKERRQTQVTMSSQTKTIGKAAIGGPWSLFNTEGRVVTDADYRGRFQFVYFGFTRCPDICPNELVKIGTIFETLESNPKVKGRIKPLFISIDPRRDTIDQLKVYSQDFHPEFDWLTGCPDQIQSMAKSFRVYWSKVDVTTDEDDDDEYSVDHTIVTYLMGPDGEFVDLFTSGVDSKQVIERMTKHVIEWDDSHPMPMVVEEEQEESTK